MSRRDLSARALDHRIRTAENQCAEVSRRMNSCVWESLGVFTMWPGGRIPLQTNPLVDPKQLGELGPVHNTALAGPVMRYERTSQEEPRVVDQQQT